MNKTKQVFLLILIFLGVGITVLLFTHKQGSANREILITSEEYIEDSWCDLDEYGNCSFYNQEEKCWEKLFLDETPKIKESNETR